MKVHIALASSSGQLSGVPRHAINLARCLLSRPEVTEVHLVAAPWQMDFVEDAAPRADARLHLHAAPIGNSALSRNSWFYAQLPKQAAQLKADIVHLAYPVPVRKGAFHCPVAVTLHDLYPYDIPQNFGFPKMLFNRAVLKQCLRAADAIACVSRSTLVRLEQLNPLLARRVSVIYNSVEPFTGSAAEAPPPQWRGQPFLLCVAQHRRNKNILLVLEVFRRLLQARQIASNMQLFIVGIHGPETSAIANFIAASGLSRSVVLVNGISDAQLHWCYRNCGLVVVASTLEGFGLPVAEALLAGCHVVCSDIPAFREVGGAHCQYVSLGPLQVESFASTVRATLEMHNPQPIALPHLSPDFIAEEYMKLYRSLLPPPAVNVRSRPAAFTSVVERRHLV
jgi:glycosyltransferase involved in cell wall biosynthesis